MTGAVSESCLIFWDLGANACAGWVQAWGSVLALGIACVGLVYQARQQRRLAESLARREFTEKYLRRSGALCAIAHAANNVLLKLVDEITEFESFVRNTDEGKYQVLLVELLAMEKWLENIPIYDVPEDVLHEMLVLSGSIRQIRRTIGVAVSNSRKMDQQQFEDFRATLSSARTSVGESALILQVRLSKARDLAEA